MVLMLLVLLCSKGLNLAQLREIRSNLTVLRQYPTARAEPVGPVSAPILLLVQYYTVGYHTLKCNVRFSRLSRG